MLHINVKQQKWQTVFQEHQCVERKKKLENWNDESGYNE